MKKQLFLLVALSCIFSLTLSAQTENLKSGLYAVLGENYVPLKYQSTNASSLNTINSVSFTVKKTSYKGVSSNFISDSTFVMVCDPKKRVVIQTSKNYDVFIKNITPDFMVILPLEVNNNKREFKKGTSRSNIDKGIGIVPFDWKQIADYTYLITAHGLVPGEYGIFFKLTKLDGYNFDGIYGFTIPEPQVEVTNTGEVKTEEAQTAENQ